jgi:hypothetical protein
VLAKDNQRLQKHVVQQKQESKRLDSTAAFLCHSSASCSWQLDLSSVTTVNSGRNSIHVPRPAPRAQETVPCPFARRRRTDQPTSGHVLYI